jgi:predicted nucleic acid-binding protein
MKETADIEAMYIDTSVAVKLYFTESDSDSCEMTARGTTLVSSRLLYCEFRSALFGKISRGKLPAESGTRVWQAFELDVSSDKIRLVSLSDLLVQDAADLLRDLHPHVPLRTLDALHLVTFLSVDSGPLFTKDLRMRQAATHLGLPLAD